MIILTDIHGNFDTMIALLDTIPQEEKDKGIAICGDLIDRGPKSMQIVQWCMDNNIMVVKGNHEQMMIDWIANGCNYNDMLWLGNGGLETLDSYKETAEGEYLKGDVDMVKLKEHAMWMDTLPYYIEFPDITNDEGRYLVISHSNAGNVWKNKDTEYAESQILWGRPRKIDDAPEIYNVIGHTPQEFGARYRKTYCNIDTGCAYLSGGFQRLTALQFPEMIFYEHGNIDSFDDTSLIRKLSIQDLKKNKRRYRVKP